MIKKIAKAVSVGAKAGVVGKAVKKAPKVMFKNRTPKQMIGAVKKKIKGY